MVIKEYDQLSSEIELRLKEKNTIFRYLLLLITAVIAGIWKFDKASCEPNHIMLILLLIIPLTTFLLTFIYNWHDRMIVQLATYIEQELRPKIISYFNDETLLGWGNFLNKQRHGHKWKMNAFLMRLSFTFPILISVVGYFLLFYCKSQNYLLITLLSIDTIALILIIILFFCVDISYRKIRHCNSESINETDGSKSYEHGSHE